MNTGIFTKEFFVTARSPQRLLLTPERADDLAESLRRHFREDATASTTDALGTELAEDASKICWYQRLKIPGLNLYTTSDHGRLDFPGDPGWLNTLGNRLTSEEGAVLRPMPKWGYIKPVLPDLSGKSVLDIGCNNGFFSFEFSDLGASHVTGVDVYDLFLHGALWMKSLRKVENVEFILMDALLDLSLPKHDIVFMSEVHAHFVDPLFGILRAVNLAKKTLIIDGPALPSENIELDLGGEVNSETRKLLYHAWIMSDGLMLRYLWLCGVEPERVTRYTAPWPNHILYVIDTANVESFRKTFDFQPCNFSFINAQFSFPSRAR